MMNKIDIDKKIRGYFYCILDNDDVIFNKRNKKTLGKYLFCKIKLNVEGATIKLIKKELSRVATGEIENYYIEIVNQLHINVLPYELKRKINQDFRMLKQKYNKYIVDVENKINNLQMKIESLENEIVGIKKRTYKASIKQDLSGAIIDIRRIKQREFQIHTYISTLEFDKEYVKKCWVNQFGENDAICEKVIKDLVLFYTKNSELFKEDETFIIQKQHIKAARSNLRNEYVLFFKVKLMPIYEKIFYKNLKDYFTKELNSIKYDIIEPPDIPYIDHLATLKEENDIAYLSELKTFYSNFNIVNELENLIQSSAFSDSRKKLLSECILLFKSCQYSLLLNLLPIQIEGLFYDLNLDNKSRQLLTKIFTCEAKTLKEKLDDLDEQSQIDVYEYFYYYFNGMIRNVAAHGRIIGDNDVELEVLAYELILDLNCVLYYYEYKSEFVKLNKLLNGLYIFNNRETDYIKQIVYGRLFFILKGDAYASIVKYSSYRFDPILVLYWLLNPTFQAMYTSLYDIKPLLYVREIIMSVEFWKYIESKIQSCIEAGYDYEDVCGKFKSVLDRLLPIVESSELKALLIKVKSLLKKLSALNYDFLKRIALS